MRPPEPEKPEEEKKDPPKPEGEEGEEGEESKQHDADKDLKALPKYYYLNILVRSNFYYLTPNCYSFNCVMRP